MVQNLKVDIIYHMTTSDFEMEFNLCGCCRMRLLSDKTSDKKTFIKALARDVSRSRVIIVCGPLFGNDGIISTVATAIGSSTMPCDNKIYGINSAEQIHIINGSTPLVTADGYFGGCIIESGPQTIILLTENKAFRKSIMQNLIHPYIEEISYVPTKNATPVKDEEEPLFETAISEEENYLTQPDDYNLENSNFEEQLPALEDEHNIKFIMDDSSDADDASSTEESTPVFDANYNLMYTEVEKAEDIKSRYANPYTPSESDVMFIAERDNEEILYKQESSKRTLDITIVILVLLLSLSLLTLLYFTVLRPVTMGVEVGEYLKEIFGLASDKTLI